MIDLYKIEGTSNIDEEQHRDCYTDPLFWKSFQDDMKKFKEKLIDCNINNKPLSILRMGHAEHCLFNLLIPFEKKGKIITQNILPRHYTKQQPLEVWIKLLESINSSDYITTQIGKDFQSWIWDLIHYKNIYVTFKEKNNLQELFNNRINFTKKLF